MAGARRVPRALVFRLGGRVLAAASGPGGSVVEIESCTRVPTGPAHLVGLANAQGTVLSLVDVRPLLGLASAAWQWPLRAQVVDGQARVAIAVEEILGFDAFDPDHLEPLGEEVPEGLRSFGQGVLALPAGPAVLLDLPAIVEALKLRRPHRPSDDPGGEPTS